MVVVYDAITGAFDSAEWNDEELRERDAERECPKCGRRIDPDEEVSIQIGGRDGI